MLALLLIPILMLGTLFLVFMAVTDESVPAYEYPDTIKSDALAQQNAA